MRTKFYFSHRYAFFEVLMSFIRLMVRILTFLPLLNWIKNDVTRMMYQEWRSEIKKDKFIKSFAKSINSKDFFLFFFFVKWFKWLKTILKWLWKSHSVGTFLASFQTKLFAVIQINKSIKNQKNEGIQLKTINGKLVGVGGEYQHQNV